jgi:regulator of CtrA degradation
MSLAQANKEKAKVKLAAGDGGDADMIQMLPERLRELIDRSVRLQERVRRLDATIHAHSGAKAEINPVERQVSLLRAAFERDGA